MGQTGEQRFFSKCPCVMERERQQVVQAGDIWRIHISVVEKC